MHAAFLRRPRSWKAFSFFFRLFLVGSTLLFWLITAARNISAIAVGENRSPGQKARIK
jgi:hypothetical protein